MRKRTAALLALALAVSLLFGCASAGEQTQPTEQETTAAPTLPVPDDGNPGDATCQGSYTGTPDMEKVVARCGSGELTNAQLQAWYWSAVASYRNAGQDQAPDFEIPLESQPCPIDDSVNSWQQYFLKQALRSWHTAQSLWELSQEAGLPVDEDFDPAFMNEYRVENLEGIPAVKYLYREGGYRPNTKHQNYLDSLPQVFDEIAAEAGCADGEDMAAVCFGTTAQGLADMASVYNRGYAYFTDRSYYIEIDDDEVESWFLENEQAYAQQGIDWNSGRYVDIRQILLVPEVSEDYPDLTVQIGENGAVACDEVLWQECLKQAEDLVWKWKTHGRPGRESTFADFASKYSADNGTAADGGAYNRVSQGQLIPQLDTWCFDGSRKPGDYEILRTDYGCHIVYFSGASDIWAAQGRDDLMAARQEALVTEAAEAYPIDVTYPDITLAQASGTVAMERLLYPDVAHERFPEVPIYLQQDYPTTMYGAYRLRSHGCGPVSLCMLATYMTDEEWTPPELAYRYGWYNTEHGTDVTLFMYEPAALGFYGRTVYKDEDAYQCLKEGKMLISLQQAGYWTSTGHYIVVEKLNEDGSVQVRDSNLFNYGKLEAHKKDSHAWEDVTRSCKVYWAFDPKVVAIPACSRCGSGGGVTESLLQSPYLCRKCHPALIRREAYLSLTDCGTVEP